MPDDKTFALTYHELASEDRGGFRDIAELRDPDGIVAVITERVADGRISFGLFREFTVGGEDRRSAYLAHRHIAGAHRVLAELDRRLEQIEDRARARRRMAAAG